MANKKIIKVIRPIVILSILLGGGYYGYRYVAAKKPAEKDTYYGNVDIRDVTLAFRVPGRVEKVMVTEGDRVKAGQVLATLDRAPFELTLAQALAAAEVARAQLKNVEAGARREDISQARAVLKERQAAQARADDTYDRVKRLEAAGVTTTQELVDAKAAAEQSHASVVASQATVQKLINGARSEEIVIAHAQADQAEAAVAVAELNLRDTELKAETPGVLVTRVIEPGTMVQAGSPALVVAFEDPVWVRGFAPEKDLARLKPGSKVRVYTDARPGRPYTGQIGYVSPQAEFTPKNVETEELRSSLVYRFRVVVSDHDGGLRQGMPVTIRAGAAGH